MTKGAPAKQVERKCNVCGRKQQITPRFGRIPPTCAACVRKTSGFNSTGPRP